MTCPRPEILDVRALRALLQGDRQQIDRLVRLGEKLAQKLAQDPDAGEDRPSSTGDEAKEED